MTRIQVGLYRRVLAELSKHGVHLGEIPVLQLASNPDALSRFESLIPSVVAAVDVTRRHEVREFLRSMANSAKRIAAGLRGEQKEYRDAMVSLFASLLAGWEPDKRMLTQLAVRVPEVYTDNQYAYLITDEDEAAIVVSLYPETVKAVLKEHLKRSIRSVEFYKGSFTLKLFDTKYNVYRVGDVVSLLHSIGMTAMARNRLEEIIAGSLKNVRYVKKVQIDKSDTVVIELDPAELPLEGIDKDVLDTVLKGAEVRIVGKVRYSDAGVTDAYIELDSPALGIVRMPAYGFSVNDQEAPVKFVTNAVDNLRVFLMKYSIVLLEVNEKARMYGFKSVPMREPNAEYKAVYTKEEGPVVAKVDVEVRWGVVSSMLAEVTANIKNAGKVVKRLEEVLTEYRYYSPVLTVSGDTVKIELGAPLGELRPALFDAVNTLMHDLNMVTSSASADIDPVHSAALYVALTVIGVKNPLEAAAKLASITQSELIARMNSLLEKYNWRAEPEVYASDPDKIVWVLMESGALSLDRNLEPVLAGRKVRELLAAFPAFSMRYNIDAVSTAVASRVAMHYYHKKRATVLEHLAESGELTMDAVRRYIEELRGPMSLSTLMMTVGDRRLWDLMPPNLKIGALRLMKADDIKLMLVTHPEASKKREEVLLIAEAYCEKVKPSMCTDFVLGFTDIVQVPKTAKVVEHGGEKWIEAGAYRMQIEGLREGRIVFRVFDKVTGKLYRTTATDIREAVRKATVGEGVEYINA